MTKDVLAEPRQGCGAHVCFIRAPKGMGNNGPCRCFDRIGKAIARARAEGLVEGMREAAQIMHKYPDVGLVWERIAAAERELTGEEDKDA